MLSWMALFLSLVLLSSGFHGTVTRGPITPVCKVGTPCTAPAVGAVRVFSRNGAVAARVRTGADGRYAVRLRPGFYTVSTRPVSKIGSIEPRRVHVQTGLFGRLDFRIDTGIR